MMRLRMVTAWTAVAGVSQKPGRVTDEEGSKEEMVERKTSSRI